MHVGNIGPIAHQPTGFDKGALGIGRGNKLARNFLAATLMIGTLYWIKL